MDKTCAPAGACNCCGSVVFEAGQYLENDGASRAKRWAESRDSPDGIVDAESPTGFTMSARSWAMEARNSVGAIDIVSEEFIRHIFD